MGKRGPQAKPGERKDYPTGVRLDAKLRAKLVDSAELNQRSLSKEIEARLLLSYDEVARRDSEYGGASTAALLQLITGF